MDGEMDRSTILAADVDEAIAAVAAEISRTRLSCAGWPEVNEKALWAQLTSCILGSAVRAEHASAALLALDGSGVLAELRLNWNHSLLGDVHAVLVEPIIDTSTGRSFRYRFPSRSTSVVASAEMFYGPSGAGIAHSLKQFHDGVAARQWLTKNVPGVGPKQASLFLRLIGYELDLAVLDVHILRYLELHGAQIDRSPSSLRTYEKREEQFRQRAERFGFSVGVVDYATWVVMRSVDRSLL